MPPPSLIRLPRSLLSLAILAVLVAVAVRFWHLKPISQRLWTADELAMYNGTDDSLPILLGILGSFQPPVSFDLESRMVCYLTFGFACLLDCSSVFDVTKGKSHYGPGGGYNHFAGRDASRAFVSGNFTGDGLTDTLHGLSSVEVKSVVDWRSFYFRSYTYAGKLVGRYYDKRGNATKYLKGVEAKAARGTQLLEKQKEEEAKIPNCNSRWSEQDGGQVWCDKGYPRLVQRPHEIALTGKMSRRCACFLEEDLSQPGLELYEDCESESQTCQVS